MTEDMPTAVSAPSSQVLPYADQAMAPTVIYASFGSRLLAWLIDWMVLLGIRFAVMCVIGMVLVGTEKVGWETESVKTIEAWIVLALLYLCAWPYYALMEASPRQATIGKRALNLQIHDIEMGRPTRVQTSIRFFFRIVSSLLLGCGFLWALISKRHQTVHDIAANCMVLDVSRSPVLPAPIG